MSIADRTIPEACRSDGPEGFIRLNTSREFARRKSGQDRTQAIILAAGRGSRLGDANGHQPKCLAEVNGRRLIDYQLDALFRVGIKEVCVVTGYRADSVRVAAGDRAHFIHNPEWANTNSLYSLSLCRAWVLDAVLILNCDVLSHPDVLHRLTVAEGSALAYDSSSGDDQEHMKVELVDGFLTAMDKQLAPQRVCGENVGILYFSNEATHLLFAQAEQLIRSGGANLWLASAVERVGRQSPLRGVDVCDLPWIEIDFEADLGYARKWVGPAIQTAVAPVDVSLVGEAA